MTYSAIPRGPAAHHVLVWTVGTNRSTGAPEAVGFWTGLEPVTFTVEGEARLYHGAGAVLQIPEIIARPGGVVQSIELGLSANAQIVNAALRGYDPRLADIQIHTARFDPQSRALLGIDRAFVGFIDGTSRRRPPKGEAGAGWTVRAVSGARLLTKPQNGKRSDATQRRRLLPNGQPCRWFQYADVAGLIPRLWGEGRS